MRSKKQLIPPVLYLICILYITILSRTPALFHTVRLTPFWSYLSFIKGNWSRGSSIGLNIVLFIPLGYLLSRATRSKWVTLVTSLAVTIGIELIHYCTYYGYLDIDDIISNIIGGAIGYYAYYWFGNKLEKLPVPLIALAAGLVGCFIVSGNTQTYEAQYEFMISSVETGDSQITFTGVCNIYERESFDYDIELKSGSTIYTTELQKDGGEFEAVANVPGDGVYEINIIFHGYQPITTRTWINEGNIEHVDPKTPEPKISGTDLGYIVENGILRVYNAEYDYYVYQVEDKLYWLIGRDFDASIMYQLYTDEPENLPEERQKYGFDNRGFKKDGEKEITGKMKCGSYRVFSDIIPTEYHITAVMVGMNKGPDYLWKDCFRVR